MREGNGRVAGGGNRQEYLECRYTDANGWEREEATLKSGKTASRAQTCRAEKGPDPGQTPAALEVPQYLSRRFRATSGGAASCRAVGRMRGRQAAPQTRHSSLRAIMAVAKGRCGPIPPRGGPSRKRRFPRMEGRTRLGRRPAHRFLSGDSSSRGQWTCRRSCIRPGTRVRRPLTPGNRLPGRRIVKQFQIQLWNRRDISKLHFVLDIRSGGRLGRETTPFQ